jgi:hypothetical protein
MPAPIFNFRNVKVRVANDQATTIYKVSSFDSNIPNNTLPPGVDPTEVSIVLLTVQCSNITGSPSSPTQRKTINLSVWVDNPPDPLYSPVARRYLVNNYTLIPNNAFDPLNGNLIMSSGDSLVVQVSNPPAETTNTSTDNCVDVIVSLLEIANATAT